jgi:hypothetical protein
MLYMFQIKRLSLCGGKSVRKAVRKMIDTLMANDWQRLHNWTGLSGKRSFKKLQCCIVLLGKELVLFFIMIIHLHVVVVIKHELCFSFLSFF